MLLILLHYFYNNTISTQVYTFKKLFRFHSLAYRKCLPIGINTDILPLFHDF